MTWSYSGDPADGGLDEVRFLVQDTDPMVPLLTDEEIEWLIEEWEPKYGSLTYVASIAAASISRKFAGIVSVTADGVSVNTAELAEKYHQMAIQLRDEYVAEQIGGEVNIDNILIGYAPDPRIRPLRFSVGLHDNPMAGLQDYGGWSYDPFVDAAAISWPG